MKKEMSTVLIIICILIICTSLSNGRPSTRDSVENSEQFERTARDDCIKIQNLKKNVYNYLESKLIHLSKAQQELLARKLINKLHRHFNNRRIREHGPWTDNAEMFARML